MTNEATHALYAVAIGLRATLFMDLWALVVKRAFSIASPNYCLIGRWFCHMPQGIFTHASIANASQKPLECAVGWISHYVVGATYAIILVPLVSDSWLARPTLLPALLFGACTVVVPFVVMHPSFGLGIAASRTPNPTQARLKSLMAHTAFGVGLWHWRRARSAAIAGLLWLVHGGYECLVYARILCSGECNIRADLLAIATWFP
jgi:hypothetical protein